MPFVISFSSTFVCCIFPVTVANDYKTFIKHDIMNTVIGLLRFQICKRTHAHIPYKLLINGKNRLPFNALYLLILAA